MPDLQRVNDTKEKILSIIGAHGPSFPARIARETGMSPMFVAAFLSEMVSEKKLKLSNMKVGSSPIYLLPTQDQALENFSSYLNPKEREAFDMLKSQKILDDSAQDPAIRVALRKIKDFAIPVSIKSGTQDQLFWKYYLVTDQEALNILQPPKSVETKEPKKESVIETKEIEPIRIPKEKKPKAAKKSSELLDQVKIHLTSRDIELLQEVASKNKEVYAKIRIDTPLGKQEFFMTAKDKKKLTEDDLAAAIHRAQAEKMPALLITTGELDKDAKLYLEQWKNVLKIDKLK